MFTRTVCACKECTDCCKRQPGPLAPGDLERIAEHLGETLEEAKAHFWASPGATVVAVASRRIFQIGSITPRLEHGRCVFLDDEDRCKVHAVAPAGCAYFDTHMGSEEAQRRGLWLLRQTATAAYQVLRRGLPFATSYKPRSY